MTYKDPWKRSLPGHAELRQLHETLRDEVRARWNRSLPFPDELFDRWERAAHLGFGDGSSIYDASLVIGEVAVGADTWIGPFTVLDGSGGLTIGSHCSISSGVHIYTHDTVMRSLTAGRAAPRSAPVSVGDRTYIGPRSIITAGVSVGEQCVVGAASLVNRDVADRTVVHGTPARVVGRVEVDGDDVRIVSGDGGDVGDGRRG